MAHAIPVSFEESPGADGGLICAYRFEPGASPKEISGAEFVASLNAPNTVTWLHFNLSDVRARRWLLEAAFLPEALRELLQEHDDRRRLELADDGLLLVVSDFNYEHDADPTEMVRLWAYADRNLLITARLHPLKSTDDLRLKVRRGYSAPSGVALAAELLALRNTRIKLLAEEMTLQLDEIEDEILAGGIEEQRELLGRTRRMCARLRRELAPERAELSKLLNRYGGAFDESDHEALTEAAEALGFIIESIAELYERAKLLQEELASRLAENTGRNLYVLSILTAVLLPMTLVTGVFGMNVAGLPGLANPGAFWWVMVLILASGAATLGLFFWRRLL